MMKYIHIPFGGASSLNDAMRIWGQSEDEKRPLHARNLSPSIRSSKSNNIKTSKRIIKNKQNQKSIIKHMKYYLKYKQRQILETQNHQKTFISFRIHFHEKYTL